MLSLVHAALLCPHTRHNRNIFTRIPGDCRRELIRWQSRAKVCQGHDAAASCPHLAILSIVFVSSYLSSQLLGRILLGLHPQLLDAQIISLTHSKHSKHHWPGLAHSSNIKKVLPVIFYPLMPWWDEFPSVSNFLPPPDTKLCEYRLELVIISIIFSSLFFIRAGLHPCIFYKRKSPVWDLRSADKVYFSNLHCSEVEILSWIEINPHVDFKVSSNESLSAPLFLSLILFPAALRWNKMNNFHLSVIQPA